MRHRTLFLDLLFSYQRRCSTSHTLLLVEIIFVGNFCNFEGLPKNYKKFNKFEFFWKAIYYGFLIHRINLMWKIFNHKKFTISYVFKQMYIIYEGIVREQRNTCLGDKNKSSNGYVIYKISFHTYILNSPNV